MKLWKCPAIVTRLTDDRTCRIIDRAAEKVRREYDASPADGGELRKLAQDVWALNKPVGLHTDATRAGYWVFGVVLINDPGLLLFTDSILYDLPVGTVYAIDGRRRHGALAHNEVRPGLFAFLAWDVDKKTEVAELIEDFAPSLEAWINDEPRVNVA